jgi:hypothetical protein
MSAIKLLTILAMTTVIVGPAHADWQCGEVTVTETRLTSDHLAELSFKGFYRDLLKKDGFKFQFTKDGGAKLNGKRCKEDK